MNYTFSSINNTSHLMVEGVDLVKLAGLSNYPLYILNENHFRHNMFQYETALLKEYNSSSEIFYASKAGINTAICQMINQSNLGLDVASEGELYIALNAGFPANKILMHGNNKSEREIEYAIQSKIKCIVLDNQDEIQFISKYCELYQHNIELLIRINPDIDVHTHRHINTGDGESKFGFKLDLSHIIQVIEMIKRCNKLTFSGLHIHIGSQITDFEDYNQAISAITKLIIDLHHQNISVPKLNLGGGLGITYMRDDQPIHIADFIKFLSEKLTNVFSAHNLPLPHLMIEPGRSIIGEAGITLYKIGYSKVMDNGTTIVAVNGGMSDNIRPELYQAQYDAVIANKYNQEKSQKTKIVGKCCETGDILIEEIFLPKTEYGDVLAVFSTGAYSYSMASNYNKLPIPGMISIKDGHYAWIIKPQTVDDLVRFDLKPCYLNLSDLS